MKVPHFLKLPAIILLVTQAGTWLQASLSEPLVGPDLVFEERNGILALEAEHFYKQTQTDTRAFHRTSGNEIPSVEPDSDGPHVLRTSRGAYVEILPDTRTTHEDKLVPGENFHREPGAAAILHYKTWFNQAGRYYVWCRVFSRGTEDNGVHLGIDGRWPESGRRWQTTKKHSWLWECRQRTEKVHIGVPMELYLDVDEPGEHEIMLSMREDGFEVDKLLLVLDREYEPHSKGPEVHVKSGSLPPAIEIPDSYTEEILSDAMPSGRKVFPGLSMNSQNFPVTGSAYYKDRNRWLAINPDQHREASTEQSFPHPSDTYNVTLHMVGEYDGQSSYHVSIGGKALDTAQCPLAKTNFEEGSRYTKTWNGIRIEHGDSITVHAEVHSKDGQEFARARWIGITFVPTREAPEPIASSTELVAPREPDGNGSIHLSGELRQWHTITLSAEGPFAQERDNAPNPFTDYKMTVAFQHEDEARPFVVPAYFAADGNAGETSAQSGVIWRAHFTPNRVGKWSYQVEFVQGKEVAVGGTAENKVKLLDGKSGEFTISSCNKTGRDFRSKGRLEYVGERYLRFSGDHSYFIKAGPDAPETFLAYADFDDTYGLKGYFPIKTWANHIRDWEPGDPEWGNGKGHGIIGAINYLASKGLNTMGFITYNAGGDGDNVWPFIERNAKMNYDCSKLDQWGIVFAHAQRLGLHLNVKLQETEMDDQRLNPERRPAEVPEALDGGACGPERRLYLRELIARFGHHLALTWILGEENTQTPEEQKAMGNYIRETDAYDHHIVIHSYPQDQDLVYRPLLGTDSPLTGASLQNDWHQVHKLTKKWIHLSESAGKPWVVANDEQGPAGFGAPPDSGYSGFEKSNFIGLTYDMHNIRKLTLWGNLMAGGSGVEYYFGYRLPQNDLLCEDYRSRDQSWDYCRIALQFFNEHQIPFWEMESSDELLVDMIPGVNDQFCFAKENTIYLVFIPRGGTAQLDLSKAEGTYEIKWFNPRIGGPLQDGSAKQLEGSGIADLGMASGDPQLDWLAVIRRQE